MLVAEWDLCFTLEFNLASCVETLSQRDWIWLSAPSTLRVSSEDKLSIRVAFFKATVRLLCSVRPCTCLLMWMLYKRIMMLVRMGIKIKGQEIQPMITKNRIANGKSIKVVTVAEDMKSRTDSKDRSVCAKEPTDTGLFSNFIPSTRSMISEDNFTSILEPAKSTKWERMSFNE